MSIQICHFIKSNKKAFGDRMQIKENIDFTSVQRTLHTFFLFYSPNNTMMRLLLLRKNNLLAQGHHS